jgi:ABC-type transport system involved in multi-copper enzyme maturation permease subunit
MSRFFEVFRFECAVQWRSPLFLLVAAAFFLLAFAAMASENVQVGGGTGSLQLNAAFIILQTTYVFAILGMFAGVAFVAMPITRDHELRTAELFMATGVPRLGFLLGRFAGGFLFAYLAAAASVLGTLVGTWMPWLDPERLRAFELLPYAYALGAVLLPCMLVTGAIFFAVAAVGRSLVGAYLAAVALLIAWVVMQINTDAETLATTALWDPFGILAFAEQTRYWTVFERNAEVPALTGVVLTNRLIWLGIAAAALALAAWRFDFSPPRRRGRRRRPGPEPLAPVAASPWRRVAPGFDAGTVWRQLGSQVRMDARGVFLSVPFYVLLAFAVMNALGALFNSITPIYGAPVYPRTGVLVTALQGSYVFVVVAIIVYYAGELTHRERSSRIAGIVDASPVPSGVLAASKILALWGVIVAFLGVGMITSVLFQLGHGYTDLDLGVYAFGLFVVGGWTPYLLTVLAVAVQALLSNRFVGMLALILAFVVQISLDGLGFEHVLYQLGTPDAVHSDLNGWHPFVEPLLTIGAYWSAFALLLWVAAHLFMRRGEPAGWSERLADARGRFGPGVRAVTVAAIVAMAGLGGWIYYNTNVQNEYLTEDDRQAAAAAYEKRYSALRERPTPEPVAMDVAVDIFPDGPRLLSAGTATLRNVHAVAVDEVMISLAPALEVDALAIADARLAGQDEDQGVYHFALTAPLAPGEDVTLTWRLRWETPGFANDGPNLRLLRNGTFVNSTEIMPLPGYDASRELTDNNDRRKYGLGPARRAAPYGSAGDDAPGGLGVRARTEFRARVSTAADQIAVAPGYLVRDWEEGSRRHFEYRMDAPIWPFVSFSSARYAVANDVWRDVALQVFHHPAHHHNVARMIEASRKSLDYFTEAFGPYQYRQFRILEFPGYERFAQAFPNTIPYSEAIGFVSDLRDPKDIDVVFYVTAHELAHQWWAHQVIGRDEQGSTFIVETLAQYSALMVLEHEYGPQQMRRFLKYELDAYLSGRGGELIEELPLKLVENQPYVHYRKGSIAMYALRDAIGESAVNRALARFVDRHAFQGPPFPQTGDLLALFREEAGPAHEQLITDLFERITVYDLAVDEATARPLGDGRHRVTLTVSARKLYADGQGREQEAPLEQMLDVGVFPAADPSLGPNDLPPPLVLEKHRISSGTRTLEFVVDGVPERVGIDPYVKMIDRNPDDNLRRVTPQPGPG